MKYVSHNGKVVKSEQASLSVLNKAMFFNFAVYESVKVVSGKVHFESDHVNRLLDSASAIGLRHDFQKKEISHWITELINKEQVGNALLRILLVGAADEHEKPQLYIMPLGLTFYPDKFYRRGVKVVTYLGERLLPKAKSKDLLLNFLAYREAVKSEALDAVLVDREGNIQEGTRSNLFAIKNNTLITPPVGEVLDGITRRALLKAVRAGGDMKIVEENIPAENITEYDGLFLTSTSMNVMPICQIDETVIAEAVHPKIKVIASQFKEYCRNHA